MLRTIIIDDEEPAIELMQTLLSVYSEIELVDTYTSADEALLHIGETRPDVIFLDIEMPERNGLEAAELFAGACPGVEIVFATAYNQYATDAFELSAIDYILKPITQTRLNKTITRLTARKAERGKKKEPDRKEERFVCFGSFEWRIGNEHEGSLKWRTTKERELLAYFVHNRNTWIRKEKIMDDLWSDAIPEYAKTFLHTCVYTNRKKLESRGYANVLEFKNNCYCLDMTGMVCDAELFEKFSAKEPDVNAENINEAEYAAGLYKGDYMEGYVWAMDKQEELRLAYLLLLKKISSYYLSIGKYQTALMYLRQLLQKEPFLDDANEMMLTLYARMGDRGSMIKHYELFTALLKEELSIAPLESTSRLYSRLLAGKAEEN